MLGTVILPAGSSRLWEEGHLGAAAAAAPGWWLPVEVGGLLVSAGLPRLLEVGTARGIASGAPPVPVGSAPSKKRRTRCRHRTGPLTKAIHLVVEPGKPSVLAWTSTGAGKLSQDLGPGLLRLSLFGYDFIEARSKQVLPSLVKLVLC